MQRAHLPAAMALSTLLAVPATAQELLHHAQGIESQLSQTVRLADSWGEGAADAIFAAEPRDVETRTVSRSPDEEFIQVQLLLHGEWGWFHFSYDETDIRRDEPEATGRRTLRFAADVDDDGQNEIVLLERSVTTLVPVDEHGDPTGEGAPKYSEHRVGVRFLDRNKGALVETVMTGDPNETGFATLLGMELGGPANAALQLLAGDYLFSQKRYGEARYRYQVAREWAERSLAGHHVDELSPGMTVSEPDPDLAEFTWITARYRFGALPPYFQRRY